MSVLYKELTSERAELESRLNRLNDFIANPVYGQPEMRQQRLLDMQRNAMNIYMAVLDTRIGQLTPATYPSADTPAVVTLGGAMLGNITL
ncbi:MAG: hypothetical protein LBJ76_00830 [Candidatus Accumulibacter sp.]|jgi:hypothetical protein|nr:hypothetical protein [Accumulibacter sp.]